MYPLITLYGINNLGKTTQAERLVQKLRGIGRRSELLKYPRYEIEPSGPWLDRILRRGQTASSQREVELWFVINRYQAAPLLEEMLKQSIVVSEDYVGTGIAWGVANGADLDWMEAINQNLRHEDLAILLDGERFEGAVEKNHRHETNTELIERCRQVHLDLAKRYGWPIVNANATIDTVHAAIWQLINERFHFAA